VHWIIERGQQLAPQWEEFAAELTYAPKTAFYMYEPSTAPPRKAAGWRDWAVKTFFPSPTQIREGGFVDRLAKTVLRWVDRRPSLANTLERAEFIVKSPVFGCQECGNCVLGNMQHVCPQTCPKQLRNGPCGGTNKGQCEVIPEQPCIWVKVYDRAKAANQLELLKVYIPPPDRSLKGTSSWINYFLNKDSRPGHPKAGSAGPESKTEPVEPSKEKVTV
jgi:methylenetetrahydrofolate reductase (NADPH)